MKPACIESTISNAYQGADPVIKTSLQISRKNNALIWFYVPSNFSTQVAGSHFWGQIIPISTRWINMPEANNFAKEQRLAHFLQLH